MLNKNAIGLDVGHSTVKIRYTLDGVVESEIFPSIVISAFPITDETESDKAAKETVTYKNKNYFFGETAIAQSNGAEISGLSDDWVNDLLYSVLLLGAFKKLKDKGVDVENSVLALGLPMKMTVQYKEKLTAIVKELIKVDAILILPQAAAPYQTIIYDEFGVLLDNGKVLTDQAWGVIDVGYYTTDIMSVDKGRFHQRSSGGCQGVYLAATRLKELLLNNKGLNCSLVECEKALRTRIIKNFDETVDVTAEVDHSLDEIISLIIAEAEFLMKEKVRTFNGVLIAGGGAPLIFRQLHAKWPHLTMAKSYRYAVAEGMRRAGEADLRRRGFNLIAA
jgi:plasmid segregation protein ParM